MPFVRTPAGIKPLEVVLTGIPPGGGGGGGVSKPQMATIYPFITNDLGFKALDIFETAATSATDDTKFTVMASSDQIELELGVSALSMPSDFFWTTVASGGSAGLTRWMISSAAGVPGSAPPGVAAAITEDIVAPVGSFVQNVAAQVPKSALPTESFFILLVGKPDAPGTTIAATIQDQTFLEIRT